MEKHGGKIGKIEKCNGKKGDKIRKFEKNGGEIGKLEKFNGKMGGKIGKLEEH